MTFHRRIGFLLILSFLTLSCAGNKGEEGIDPDKADLIDALTLFVEAVQADRFDKAFGYLTPQERSRMSDAGGLPTMEVKRRLKALRLSTLAQKPGVRLQHGKVEGIYDQLPSLTPLPDSPREIPPAGAGNQEVPSFQ